MLAPLPQAVPGGSDVVGAAVRGADAQGAAPFALAREATGPAGRSPQAAGSRARSRRPRRPVRQRDQVVPPEAQDLLTPKRSV